ncbi:fibronectin type III domain-containing protein [Frigoribacterium sp. PhB116]|uniref:fibronectin type III domain-containing protein n=1 Tax=Frigoribacterium sp. PhB116 TaxID=2485174 RepID=UPI0010DFEC56|nr:fibronectin type III domain-containing protein [Frigoribacterium sp. PhB116]TDT64451.1 fibronectin type III domain protein [Frigoribacterium sp. PhB116]
MNDLTTPAPLSTSGHGRRRGRLHRLALALVALTVFSGLVVPSVALGISDPSCACGGGGGGGGSNYGYLTAAPGTVGQPYDHQIPASASSMNSAWAAVDAPPPGLSLSSTGRITGVPQNVGYAQFSATATDPTYGQVIQYLISFDFAARPASAPRSVVATATGAGSVGVTWSPPADLGGPALTSYRVTWDGGSADVPAPGTQLDVTGLTTGRSYVFTVAALSAAGTGPSASSAPTTPAAPPAAPTGLTASAGASSASLSWTPSTTNGTPVTGYLVEQQPAGGAWGPAAPARVTGTTAAVTGLTDGTTYAFRVSATSAAGTSPASGTASARPVSVPGAPAVTATPGPTSDVVVQWTAPSSDGGSPVVSWQLVVSETASGTVVQRQETVQGTTSTVAGLRPGTSYSFLVQARNALGLSAPGTATAVPYTLPSAPGSPVVVPGDGSLSLSWAPAADNGSAVTRYVVALSDGGQERTVVVTGASVVLDGLRNGSPYRVVVSAENLAGEGPRSSATGTPRRAPDAPRSVVAAAGDRTATVSWTAPDSDGGSPLTGWLLEHSTDGGTSWTQQQLGPSVTTSVLAGLDNGEEALVRVTARNAAGGGATSPTVAVVPFGVPATPDDVVAVPLDRSVALSWSEPADGGSALLGYEVVVTGADGTRSVFPASSTRTTVTGLSNGTTYDVTVTALNERGRSAASAGISTTPRTVPSAPADLTAQPGPRSVALTWTVPSDGGSPVQEWVVEASTDQGWARVGTSLVPGTVVHDLVDGVRASFRVTAVNAAGDSEVSETVVATPRSAPSAPLALTALPQDRGALLSWAAPVDDGGSPVTSWLVETSTGNSDWAPAEVSGTGTTRTVSGLANGTAASFRVTAVTEAGPGSASDVVSTTPRTTPGAPASPAAAAGVEVVTLTWSAPVDDGGDAVTGYLVEQRVDDGWATVRGTDAETTATTLTGLRNGTEQELRVRAVNAAGPGAASTVAAATPRTVPDAPAGLALSPGDGMVGATWSAPAWDGGAAVARYEVEAAAPDGTLVAASSTRLAAVLEGLANGTPVDVRVRAVNAAGAGAWSTVATSTPFVFAPTISRPDGTSLEGRTVSAGDPIVFTADHLPVGAAVSLELHSVVRVLAAGVVGADGTIRLEGRIPEEAEAGDHHLVAVLDGAGTTIAPVSVSVRIDPVADPGAGRPGLGGLPAAGGLPGAVAGPASVVPARAGLAPAPTASRRALATTGDDGALAAVAGGVLLGALGTLLRVRSSRRGRPRG